MLRTFLLFTCILFASCEVKNPATVSKEEAKAAGEKLEAMVKEGDVEGILVFFHEPSFYESVTERSRASRISGVLKGLKSGNPIMHYAKQLIQAAQNGEFRFFRSYEKYGVQHLLFRIASEKGGINYHEFYVKKVNNNVKAVNAMNYIYGDQLTGVLADYLDVTMEANDKVSLFIQKKNAGDFEGMKVEYRQMPVEIQQNRGILLSYLEACQKTNDSSYKTTIEKYLELFPISGSACLLMIDLSLKEKEYDKTQLAIDKLDFIIGGDPFLNFVRGNVYQLMDQPAKSILLYESVYAYDPDQIMNIRALIAVYVEQDQVDKAKKIVDTYKTSKAFDQKVLDELNANHPELLY